MVVEEWSIFWWLSQIGALLRIPRNPWFSYKRYAKRLYLIGLDVGASQIVPLSWSLFRLLVLLIKFIFDVCCCLFVCSISLCSPSWTPCTCFLLFFSLINKILITYQKKALEDYTHVELVSYMHPTSLNSRPHLPLILLGGGSAILLHIIMILILSLSNILGPIFLSKKHWSCILCVF